MNGVGERERRHVRPALIGPSPRERERDQRDQRESGNALFFTIAFIP